MAALPPRFVVTLDRTDGGEAIEERQVVDVHLLSGMVRITGAQGVVFAGDGWNWIEVKRIEYEASVTMKAAPRPSARPRRAARSPRTTRRR